MCTCVRACVRARCACSARGALAPRQAGAAPDSRRDNYYYHNRFLTYSAKFGSEDTDADEPDTMFTIRTKIALFSTRYAIPFELCQVTIVSAVMTIIMCCG